MSLLSTFPSENRPADDGHHCYEEWRTSVACLFELLLWQSTTNAVHNIQPLLVHTLTNAPSRSVSLGLMTGRDETVHTYAAVAKM